MTNTAEYDSLSLKTAIPNNRIEARGTRVPVFDHGMGKAGKGDFAEVLRKMPFAHCRNGAEYVPLCHKMWSAIMILTNRDTFLCIAVFYFEMEAEK